MLWYAMTRYHDTLKAVLEKTLAIPDLIDQISELDRKERPRPNKYRLSHLLYTIAPKNWELAPLRDYLIGDASAMLMSHFSKMYKGENESNPPTIPGLGAITPDEFRLAYSAFTDPGATLPSGLNTRKRSTMQSRGARRESPSACPRYMPTGQSLAPRGRYCASWTVSCPTRLSSHGSNSGVAASWRCAMEITICSFVFLPVTTAIARSVQLERGFHRLQDGRMPWRKEISGLDSSP